MLSSRSRSKRTPTAQWMKKTHPTDIPDVVMASKRKVHNIRKTYNTKRSKRYHQIYSPSPSNFVDLTTSIVSTQPEEHTSSSSTRTMSKPTKIVNPYKIKKERDVSSNEGQQSLSDDTNVVVDLTLPPSLEAIKKDLPVFFTYDPTGEKDKSKITSGFCNHCLCPKPYCVDVVFGPMCYKHVERLICRLGFDEYEEERDIKRSYRSIYTDLIKSKMLMNNISFKDVHDIEYMKLPRCIRNGTLHKLIDDVNEWKDREDEGCWSELDAT